jgi:hypothetical protein
VDWRVQKARDRHGKSIAQIEQELDGLLRAPQGKPKHAAQPFPARLEPMAKAPPRPLPRPVEPFQPVLPAKPAFRDLPGTVQDLSATLAIPPAIKDHVRNLPQGVFSNMDLEVEEVKFEGDTAEAYVRFQSPNVTELVIRQRYFLRKSGEKWQVQSRQPVNGGGNPLAHSLPGERPALRMM